MNAHDAERQRIRLRVDQIEVGPRLRPVDADHVMFIAESMQAVGCQLQDILVRPPASGGGRHRLVIGAHRVGACERLGWEINCDVVEVSDDEAALMEVDENLARHDLTELDRSYTLVRRKEIYERLYPQTRHGGKRRGMDQTAQIGRLIPSFAKDLSEKLGIGERTMRKALRRYNDLAPGLHARLAGTGISRKKSELDRLVALPPERQIAVADILLSSSGPKTVVEALRQLGQVRTEAEEPAKVAARRFVVLWTKAPRAGREAILQWLAEAGVRLPKKGAAS